MYIEPSTNIRLLRNVPIDKSYKHTLYFENKTEQYNYFVSKTKHNLTRQTYQRWNVGVMRVNLKPEVVYDCNYLMFQNEGFGNKWFYAFITKVVYINNATTEVHFEIDVVQTWLLDCTIKQSFVEREHSVSDKIGGNLVPENLEHGEYVTDGFSGTNLLGAYKIVVASTVEGEGYKVTGGHYAGIYSGLYLNVFDNYEEVNEWIENVTNLGKSDGIVTIFMMPTRFVTEIGGSPKSYEITKEKGYSDFGGYTPKNNKLYTYPYNFLYVTNLDGSSATFNYEDFSTDKCVFTMAGDFSCNPNIVLFPMNYKGCVSHFDEKLVIGNFPQCSWNVDTYKAWLARGASREILGSFSQGATMFALGGSIAGAMGLATSVAGVLNSIYEHAIAPPQAHGNTGSSTQVALKIKDFMFMRKRVKAEFAKIIDNYFTTYGYATHKIKVPNISARPHWNYVKTIDSVIIGNAPSEDIAKIRALFDRGITFWKNGDEVGNYNLDNSPS